MIVSRRWLEDLLSRPLDAAQVAELLTMRCCPVDGVVPRHRDLGEVSIARVLEVKKHPNADRLSLCLVDTGSGNPVEVVCGASNVAAGKTYPFAPVGAVLPGGFKLERRKIRGVESNGMLCSAKELGLGADHEGILELATDLAELVDAHLAQVADIEVVALARSLELLLFFEFAHRGAERRLSAASWSTVPGALVWGWTGHLYGVTCCG